MTSLPIERTGGAFGLTGKVCVVTGAGSGIGREVALALASDGALVALLDRNLEGARETLGLVTAAGGTGLAIECDVSRRQSIEEAQANVSSAFGAAEVLVNNAGIIRAGALESLSLEDWNGVLAINLTGYLLCAQVFGRAMRASGNGALIHVSSIQANFPGPFTGAYCVAKAGIQMLSRQLAAEWGPDGVRSNCVLPGLVQTPLSQSVYDRPGLTERRSALVPSRRIGMPEDTAQAVLFLASPRASYINGTEILVDGGLASNFMGMVPRAGYERDEVSQAGDSSTVTK